MKSRSVAAAKLTSEAFRSALEDALNGGKGACKETIHTLRERLRRMDDPERFEALFWLAVKPRRITGVGLAAWLLRELSPACPLKCDEAVRVLLLEGDTDCNEVPFYLAARFGSARVRQAVSELKLQVVRGSDKAMLESVWHWLQLYDETYPDAAD